MPLSTSAENPALAQIVGTASVAGFGALYASLHSAYSATGASEVTPGTTRPTLTWGSASGGSIAFSGSVTFSSIPANTTVAFVGLWNNATISGSTSSQFAGMGANGGATMYAFTASAHTASSNVDTVTIPGLPTSTYANGTAVVVWSGVGTSLPSGLTAGTIYYVIGYSAPTTSPPAPATVQLSATSGGSAVNLGTTPGSGLIQAITIEQFAGAGGSFTLTGDTLSIS